MHGRANSVDVSFRACLRASRSFQVSRYNRRMSRNPFSFIGRVRLCRVYCLTLPVRPLSMSFKVIYSSIASKSTPFKYVFTLAYFCTFPCLIYTIRYAYIYHQCKYTPVCVSTPFHESYTVRLYHSVRPNPPTSIQIIQTLPYSTSMRRVLLLDRSSPSLRIQKYNLTVAIIGLGRILQSGMLAMFRVVKN